MLLLPTSKLHVGKFGFERVLSQEKKKECKRVWSKRERETEGGKENRERKREERRELRGRQRGRE